MARLPKVGDDKGTWGGILNDYLEQSHNDDGTLKNDTVGAPQLRPNSVTGAAIANGAVNASKLASSSDPTTGQALTYDGSSLAWSTITSSGSVPDATDTDKGLVRLAGDIAGTANYPLIAADAVTEAKLDSAVRTKLNAGIADGAVSTVKLADDAVTAAKLADDAVTDSTVAAGAAIAMTKIAGLSTALDAKAADAAVVHLAGGETISGNKNFTGELRQDGNAVVTTVDGRLSNERTPTNGSVSTAKLADDAVTETKLDSAVRTKLNSGVADGAVTTVKLATGAVTAEKISGLGAANGVASLDATGAIPETQVPARLSPAGVLSRINSATATVNIEDYDPDGQGIRLALLAALADAGASKRVILQPGKTYVTDAPIVATNIPVRIDFNGARILRPSTSSWYAPGIPSSILYITHDVSSPQAVTEISTQTWDFGGGYVTPMSRIATDTSGWAAGDVAVIVSDDGIPGGNPSRVPQRDGERFRVYAVTTGYLWVARPLRAVLSTNVRLAKMQQLPVELINPWLEDAPNYPTNRSSTAFAIRQVVAPLIDGMKLRNLAGEGLRLAGCFEAKVLNPDCRSLRTETDSASAYGYGIRDASSTDSLIVNPTGSLLRHLVTTGASEGVAANDPDLSKSGSTWGVRILGGAATEVGHAAFDFHEEAKDGVVQGSTVGYTHTEKFGSNFAYQLRGRRTALVASSAHSPSGVSVLTYDGGGSTSVESFTHRMPAGSTGNFISYRSGGSTPTEESFSGTLYAPAYAGPRLNRFETIKVNIPYMRMVFDTTTNPEIFTLINSEVTIQTLEIDMRGSTFSQGYLFTLTGATSKISVERLILRASGVTWKFANCDTDAGNGSASVTIGTLITDTKNTASGWGGTWGAGTTRWVRDYVIAGVSLNGAVKAATNADLTLTALDGRTVRLATPLTAARTITEATTTLATGAEFRYVRTAAATGAFDWTIGDAVLSAAGQYVVRKWDGTAWFTSERGSLT